jgi:hypothetical protein
MAERRKAMELPYESDWQSRGWKFRLGDLDVTKGAHAALQANNPEQSKPATFLFEFVERHGRGDWGEIDAFTRKLNDGLAVDSNFPVRSIYRLPDGAVIWIITERHATADGVLPRTIVLVPEEFREASFTSNVSAVPGAVDT